MTRLIRFLAAAALGIPLAGCSVPDLVAHAIKEVEKSQRDGNAASSPASAQPAPASGTASQDEPPPPAPAYQPVSRRNSISVEELPPK